ncbi:rho GTPase-activating 11A-like isoform X1 [Pelobates cultripes]|uniref:Rho GTPase-activating 11A-like isoform X1 n=1 Tax=Pelobates cultripes TaxID=61616 RepID=A0AAD1SXA9_PELCU|nr:rho GTPase-activating 11A-like isoform X1 [Pelobates cultripes]
MGLAGPSTVIIQYLKSLGIKIRPLKKSLSLDSQKKTSGDRLFGVPLPVLPLCRSEGDIPQLLVDICNFLRNHLGTEGLFRKSGSVIRIKALKADLESGKCHVDSANPGDVACLLKQFFRELPMPIIPQELQDPLCQIQDTLEEEHRVLATTLVTCLLPAIHAGTLRYFCTFLQSVAARSNENRMDSGNLAVVLAPNLFSCSALSEKLTIATERQIQLQASVMQTLIEHAESIGNTPPFILETISFPSNDAIDDIVSLPDGNNRRRRRRSMGGLVNEALSKLRSGLVSSSVTPDRVSATDEGDRNVRCKTKRKASEDTVCTEQCTAKKRKSLLGPTDDSLPSTEQCDLADSPLTDSGIGDVFLDVSLAPGPLLELTAVPPIITQTPESPVQVPRVRGKKKEGKRAHRGQSGLVSVSPGQLDRRDKVRNSLRLFHRPRIAKNPNPEESSWNYMKRMVSEALEGPIFNGRELRVTTSSLKATQLCSDISASRTSLRTTTTWKSVEMEASTGKKSRTLRRSLSMPENMADCAKVEEDGQLLYQTVDSTTSASAEEIIQEDSAVTKPDEYTPVVIEFEHPLESTSEFSLNHTISPISALSPSPPLFSKASGHPAQYRSVRKLMLSFPWVSQTSVVETEQKDCEKLATNKIRRQGARRFGRSLSHESGIGFAEGIGEKNTDCLPTQKTLNGRNRQVFVSHKNITLGVMGQRSLDVQATPSLDEELADSGGALTDIILDQSKDVCFETLVEDGLPDYEISTINPFYSHSITIIEDCIDL